MASILEWLRQRKIARRDKRLSKETDYHQKNENLILVRASLMTLGGFFGVAAAFLSPLVQQYVLLQIGCGVGAIGVGLRYIVYVDMYAFQRVHDGSKGKIVNKIESAFRSMPFRYIGLVKVLAHEVRATDLAYIKELRLKKEHEPENKDAIDKDIDNFNRISFFTDSSVHLKFGTFAALGIGVGLTKNITELAVDVGIQPFIKTGGRFTGYTSSAVFSLAQLGVYSTKRIAAGNKDYIPHPLHSFFIEKTHLFAMATPVRYASWWLLHRENKKIRKLQISAALHAYLDETDRSVQLAFLNEAAQSPRRMREITTEWLQTNKQVTGSRPSSSTFLSETLDTAKLTKFKTPERTNAKKINRQNPPDSNL